MKTEKACLWEHVLKLAKRTCPQDSFKLAKSVASLMACEMAPGFDPVACALTSLPPPFPSITPTTWSIHALAVRPFAATSCQHRNHGRQSCQHTNHGRQWQLFVSTTHLHKFLSVHRPWTSMTTFCQHYTPTQIPVSTQTMDVNDNSVSATHITCGRVVFSVCDCFVAVCGDCILCWLKVNMVLNLNIYRLDIESGLVTVLNMLFYWIFSLKSGCSFWLLVQ